MRPATANALAAGVAALACLTGCNGGGGSEPFDVLILGGDVYEGSLAGPEARNIGIRDGRIADANALATVEARRVVDARGMAVVPGFIDPHTHALEDLLDSASGVNAAWLMQGVTTVFVGNDGAGIPERARVFAMLDERGTGTDVGFFAGHNELRERVMGLADREPTAAERRKLEALLAEEMAAGALGLSTGLYYVPGSFATTEEVIALAAVAARTGGVYDTHMRSESSAGIGLAGSVREVIRIAESAGVPAHIAHLKALGSDAWGSSREIIGLVDAARERGLAITADQYPYRASGTRFSSALVPQWARADSKAAMFARFDDPDVEARLREDMAANLELRGGAGAMLVTAPGSAWQGLTLAEISAELGADPLDAALTVIRGGDPSIASFVMDEADIHAIARQSWVMTGSDGSEGHPRKYGTYPQAYREFVVEQGLFGFARFVHRSSGLPADFYGLCDRGYIADGRRADIAILDLEDYRPRANFDDPERLATGIRHLFVHGVPVVADGEPTGELPGRVIDRSALDCTP